MRVTVLGKSPSWEDAGGACSGYLVRDGDTTLLVDCGNGVFSRLRETVDYFDVDAVVISHLHADHFLDLVPFSYALTYSPRARDHPTRPVLHVPPGSAEFFRRIVGSWGSETLIEDAFELREYETEDRIEVGPLGIRFTEVPHFGPTRAIDIASSPSGSRITYGADHGPSDALVELAADTDLLLIEASITEPEREGPRGHLTPAEAGDHGRRAGAKRLVLVHVTDELDTKRVEREAAAAFGSEVRVARTGDDYDV
ncbi:MAG: MBL fold metallo-hydrolase [Actinomycetota bacterium]|nr:MBL fold metallo-hydrolase [Actinomycetota bacterium]